MLQCPLSSSLTRTRALCREFTRGKRVSLEQLQSFCESLDLPPDARAALVALTPATYLGEAARLAREV